MSIPYIIVFCIYYTTFDAAIANICRDPCEGMPSYRRVLSHCSHLLARTVYPAFSICCAANSIDAMAVALCAAVASVPDPNTAV